MRRIIPLVTFGALFAIAPLASPAQAAPAPTRAAVPYADLNLDRAADVAELDRRIGRAVRSLCGAASGVDPLGNKKIRDCRAGTRAAVAPLRDRAIAEAHTRFALQQR